MRIKDIIVESMEFGPSRLVKRNDGTMVHTPPGSKQQVECYYCDGSGKDTRTFSDTYPCQACAGTGKREEWVSDGPEMNVSNSNGFEIQRMMGIEPDYGGSVSLEDLPDLMRRLIRLKNGDTSAHTREPTTSKGTMKKTGSDGNVTSIGRGATMIDLGRSQEQIDRYVNSLIPLVKWCIDNKYDLSWG